MWKQVDLPTETASGFDQNRSQDGGVPQCVGEISQSKGSGRDP